MTVKRTDEKLLSVPNSRFGSQPPAVQERRFGTQTENASLASRLAVCLCNAQHGGHGRKNRIDWKHRRQALHLRPNRTLAGWRTMWQRLLYRFPATVET